VKCLHTGVWSEMGLLCGNSFNYKWLSSAIQHLASCSHLLFSSPSSLIISSYFLSALLLADRPEVVLNSGWGTFGMLLYITSYVTYNFSPLSHFWQQWCVKCLLWVVVGNRFIWCYPLLVTSICHQPSIPCFLFLLAIVFLFLPSSFFSSWPVVLLPHCSVTADRLEVGFKST
jgi:hypothetical protein